MVENYHAIIQKLHLNILEVVSTKQATLNQGISLTKIQDVFVHKKITANKVSV